MTPELFPRQERFLATAGAKRVSILFMLLILAGICSRAGGEAFTLQVLHKFNREEFSGFQPCSPLVALDDGSLIGSAQGGANYFGAIFRVTPNGDVSLIFSSDVRME